MDEARFASSFCALTGNRPFRWQMRLFGRFLAGDLPEACDIPTGLGKTSIMAIWLLALAEQAKTGAVTLPRRLVYVVDRRTVVDQASDVAKKIREALAEGRAPEVAAALERLSGSGENLLAISTLRGEFADNGEWRDDPARPAIVVGTVDMIGSRLLFSGYGVSRKMRPLHAGLLGADSLVVLDEAHLVPPFEALLRNIAEYTDEDARRSRASGLFGDWSVPILRVTGLSATGRKTSGSDFALSESDISDPPVAHRLSARKWLRLEEQAPATLAATMAERAWERAEGGRRVLVFCNSRKVAKDVHGALAKKLGKGAKLDAQLELIVGARRVRERERLADTFVFRRFAGRLTQEEQDLAEGSLPAFLVATSAGEVGIDIDADHMVCDLVPFERMVQRLGRVNRRGDFPESLVDVFVAIPDKEAEDQAEAERLAEWCAPFDSAAWPQREDGRRDASPGALRQLRGDAAFAALAEKATTPEPLRPALTRPLVDAWSMTSLEVHTGRPNVEPWLRGWVEREPQSRLVWRWHLPIREGEDGETAKRALKDFFEEAPPHLSEVLETETSQAVDLLVAAAKRLIGKGDRQVEAEEAEAEDESLAEGSATEQDDAGADAPKPGASEVRPTRTTIVAVALAADNDVERLFTVQELATDKKLNAEFAGRTIVLDARVGGLDDAGLIDRTEKDRPAALDNEGTSTAGREKRLWDDARLEAIGYRVRRVEAKTSADGKWGVSYRRFVRDDAEEANDPDNQAEWRVEDWLGKRVGGAEPALSHFDQCLVDHHDQARSKAADIAKRLDLPAWLHELLVEAAGVHDLGKARSRWQLYARNRKYDNSIATALAKFKRRGTPNLLEGYRHEFGSVRDVIAEKTFDRLQSPLRKLALRMIAAHHGQARPVIPPVDEMVFRDEALARQLALDFAELQRTWGPWGLAWLETLLRAADVAASREAPPRVDATASTAAEEAG